MPVNAKPYPVLADLSVEVLVSFAAKIERLGPDECWPWLAGCDGKGYGAFAFGGRVLIASRLAWVIEHGSVPVELQVLHTCDNPPCCNPAHHYLGTHGHNVHDRTVRRRMIHHRGANNCNAKLTVEQAADARRLHSEGLTATALGRRFGMSQSSMSKLIRGESYVG